MTLFTNNDSLFSNSLSPFEEAIAYELLWTKDKASFKSISELFSSSPKERPSSFVTKEMIDDFKDTFRKLFFNDKLDYKFNFLINSTIDYPVKLRDAKEPIEALYYSGNLDYIDSRCISIVGTRNPSPEGLARTRKIAKLLVKEGFTIVSGLAQGVDTMAHKTAIENNGRTIAVIGTPLDQVYPKENKDLQTFIAKNHLLISQIPFYRYSLQNPKSNRFFFPERNKTMSALSLGTIIIEASETSGTLTQARAALHQGRKLFILNSCFENKNITWPARFEKMGAIRVNDIKDILDAI